MLNDDAEQNLAYQLSALQLGMTEEDVRSFMLRLDETKRLKQWTSPPQPECPLCFHPMPLDPCGHTFNSCCSTIICFGCETDELLAALEACAKKGIDGLNNEREFYKQAKCSFCREPKGTEEECHARALKRVDAGNAVAMRCVADVYMEQGKVKKANNLRQKAADGGDLIAAYVLGASYLEGEKGVKKNVSKGLQLLEKSANGGFVFARNSLAAYHYNRNKKGDMEVAMGHWSIAAKCGSQEALNQVRDGFLASRDDGHFFTKVEYGDILRSYQRAREDLDTPSRQRAKKVLEVSIHEY